MTKNKAFKHEYTVILEGTTTNNFSSDLFMQALFSLMNAWNSMHETTKVFCIEKDEDIEQPNGII